MNDIRDITTTFKNAQKTRIVVLAAAVMLVVIVLVSAAITTPLSMSSKQ